MLREKRRNVYMSRGYSMSSVSCETIFEDETDKTDDEQTFLAVRQQLRKTRSDQEERMRRDSTEFPETKYVGNSIGIASTRHKFLKPPQSEKFGENVKKIILKGGSAKAKSKSSKPGSDAFNKDDNDVFEMPSNETGNISNVCAPCEKDTSSDIAKNIKVSENRASMKFRTLSDGQFESGELIPMFHPKVTTSRMSIDSVHSNELKKFSKRQKRGLRHSLYTNLFGRRKSHDNPGISDTPCTVYIDTRWLDQDVRGNASYRGGKAVDMNAHAPLARTLALPLVQHGFRCGDGTIKVGVNPVSICYFL